MEQTEGCQRRGQGRAGGKKMNGLAKEHVHTPHRHRQQCGDGLRGGREDCVEVGTAEKTGVFVIV